MAIKFGDLLENVNPDRAVLDLIENNAKGLLFVSDFDDQNSDQGNNEGVAGIPFEKRSIGALVCDRTTGELYCYTGSNLNEQITLPVPEVATDGAWEDTDEATREWVQIGTLEKRDTPLQANISTGPSTLSSSATLLQVIETVNLLITDPPRSFGKFVGGDQVVGDSESLSALEIIVRALSQFLQYDTTLAITSGAPLQFGQNAGTINLSFDITSVNYDLTNEAGDNIIPQSFELFYRPVESPAASWISSGGTVSIDPDNFTSNTSSATLTPSFNFNSSDVEDNFDFDGFQFKVEIRDNSDESDVAGISGAADQANPVVLISNTATATVNAYVAANGSFNQSIVNSETLDNSGLLLRSKGNKATTINWQFQTSASNADGVAATSIAINAYNMQKRVNGGSWQTVTSSDGNGDFSATGISSTGIISGTFNYQGGAENSNSTDSVAFRMVYSDASGATNQVVGGSTQSTIHFRYAIYGGFLSLGVDNQVISSTGIPASFNEAAMEALTLTTRGWSANDSTVPPGWRTSNYGNSSNSGASFPRLDIKLGRGNFAQNTIPDYSNYSNMLSETSGGTKKGSFGWVYNNVNSDGEAEVTGNGTAGLDTVPIFGIPDDSIILNAVAFPPFDSPSAGGTVTKTITNVTNAFGATCDYLVSAADTAGAWSNGDASQKNLIVFAEP